MNIKDTILHKIAEKQVFMRPRALFVALSALVVLLAAGVVSTSIFLVTYTLYFIRSTLDTSLFSFGGQGIAAYFFHFPWHLVLLDALLIVLLALVLRTMRGGHRVPLGYAIGGLLLGALLLGVVVDYARVHDVLYERRARLPLGAKMLYERGHRGAGMCKCTIVSVGTSTLVMRDDVTGEELHAVVPAGVRMATTTGLVVGQRVFVAGKEKDGVITVFGIRPADERGHRRR